MYNTKQFYKVIERRITDQYLQSWHAAVENSSKCLNYKLFKTDFIMESYISKLSSKAAIIFCKFRTTNHKLAIERGRYENVRREERSCTFCSKNLGDEYHTIVECESLLNLRKQYVKPYYYLRANVIKFSELMSSQNTKELYNLIKFINNVNNRLN